MSSSALQCPNCQSSTLATEKVAGDLHNRCQSCGVMWAMSRMGWLKLRKQVGKASSEELSELSHLRSVSNKATLQALLFLGGLLLVAGMCRL